VELSSRSQCLVIFVSRFCHTRFARKLTILGDDNLWSDWRCDGIAESWYGCRHTCRVGLGLDGRGARPSTGKRGDAASRVSTVSLLVSVVANA